MIKNERKWQSQDDVTDFTLALIKEIQEHGTASIYTRDGLIFDVVYREPTDEEDDTGGFHTEDHSYYWTNDGTSFKNRRLDITWFKPAKKEIEFPSTSSDFETLKIFDGNDMVEDLYDYLSEYFEVSNDSYYRWYVDANRNDSLKSRVDKWLIDKGAVDGEKVLIGFSW